MLRDRTRRLLARGSALALALAVLPGSYGTDGLVAQCVVDGVDLCQSDAGKNIAQRCETGPDTR
jgi:hypothetical protein